MLVIGAIEHAVDYRFRRGPELQYWTLGYLRSGRIDTRTEQGRFLRSGGSISLIPPYTAYSLKWGGGTEIWSEMYALFSPLRHWEQLLHWPPREHGLGILEIRQPSIRHEIECALEEGIRILRSARPRKMELAYNVLERVFLLLDEINPLRGNQQRDLRIQYALDYIARCFGDELNLEILARQVYLSPSRFGHLFKSQMGISPMQFVEQYRLDRAAEKLLSTDDTIEYVARAVGFENAFHFSTRFRRYLGQSPSHYRRNPQ